MVLWCYKENNMNKFDREAERAVEDFILAADEETLHRLHALILIRCGQIGSPIPGKASEDAELNA